MSGHDEDDRPIDRSLIDLAMPGLEPTDAQRTRLKRAVLGALATSAVTTGTAAGAQAAAGGAGASAATGVGGAAVGMGVGAKAVLAVVAIASVVGVVAVTRTPSAAPATQDRAPAAPREIAEPDEAPALTASAPPIEAAHEPTLAVQEPLARPAIAPTPIAATPSPRRPTTATTRATPATEPETTPSPEIDPAVVETMLLARARVALQRHDGAAAMQLLQEHASRFPSGELREERLALRISALCELGETDRAHREAASYLDAFPGSIHAADVRAADCWSAPPAQ